MRVMHLIEPWTGVGPNHGTDAAVLACGALIGATPTDWHEPIAIGATSGRMRARQLGLDVVDGITPPGGADRAWHQLRAIALVRGCPDVVQTWSEGTHRLAQRATIASVVSMPADIDAMRAALSGVVTLFLLVANVPDELTQAITTLSLARDAGVRGIVYLSVFKSEAYVDAPHFTGKHAVERMIAALDLPATVLRPSYFMQNDFAQKEPLLGAGIFGVQIGRAHV